MSNSLTIQQKMLDVVNQVVEIGKKVEVSIEKAEVLAKLISEKELLVPVVGEFSAGKSTFLNSFIGRSLLSVNVTPETAVATELRYSETEYAEIVENVADDLQVRRVSLDEAKNVQPSWRCVRLYLNSENIKKVEPIILVDMPGFDSPRDDHNKAIASYLNKGVHYVVLTSVESGTVTSSMSRQLQDIQNMGRSFSFFVSKANLRSPDDVEKIIEEVRDQVEDSLGIETDPKPLGKNAGAELSKLVSSIDPESLFAGIFSEAVEELIDYAVSAINMKIAALKADQGKNRMAIQELEESLAKLEKRRDRMVAEAQSNHFDADVDAIVNAAGAALSNKVDELTEMAMNGASSEAISQEMNAVVRSSVIPAINKVSQNASERISTSFQMELRGVENTFSAFDNPEFMAKLGTAAASLGDVAKSSLASLTSMTKKNSAALGAAYKTIVGALGIATNVFAPVVEIVLLFLPEIISFFTQKSRENEQREKIRSQILSSIPKMKQELREKITPVLVEQNVAAINAISEQFDSKISAMRDEIKKANDALENNEDVVVKMKNLEESRATLNILKKSL